MGPDMRAGLISRDQWFATEPVGLGRYFKVNGVAAEGGTAESSTKPPAAAGTPPARKPAGCR